ncbi:hypothetical protein HQ531_05250 [bacterium]|nr:hypothetical protein [bacterium]
MNIIKRFLNVLKAGNSTRLSSQMRDTAAPFPSQSGISDLYPHTSFEYSFFYQWTRKGDLD